MPRLTWNPSLIPHPPKSLLPLKTRNSPNCGLRRESQRCWPETMLYWKYANPVPDAPPHHPLYSRSLFPWPAPHSRYRSIENLLSPWFTRSPLIYAIAHARHRWAHFGFGWQPRLPWPAPQPAADFRSCLPQVLPLNGQPNAVPHVWRPWHQGADTILATSKRP